MKLRPFGLALLLLIVISLSSGTPAARDTVESNTEPYRFGLGAWEVQALVRAGAAQIGRQLTSAPVGQVQGVELVRRYFSLQGQIDGLRNDLERAAASRLDTAGIQRDIDSLREEQAAIEPAAERALAAQVGDVLRREGLGRGPGGRILFPPVLFKLAPLPTLLAVSPRERIELEGSHLLRPGLPVPARERVEDQASRLGVSPLVTDIGGLATYPSFVPSSYGLEFTLGTVSHEWLHQYLAFQPLGRAYGASRDMTSLNETVATLFGDELGARLYHDLYGGPAPPPAAKEAGAGPPPPGGFDFTREMRQTRLGSEELLRQGKIDEAEAYMEERRQFLLANGYYLRKLNQAYFAFHGTYAEGPASISPLGRQVRSVRLRSAGLGDFIHTMQNFRRFEDFQAYLKAQGLEAGAPTAP